MKRALGHGASRHFVWCVLVLGGCECPQPVPAGEQFVELARASGVRLAIVNESGRELELVGSQGAGPVLAAGASVDLPLVVTKVAKLSEMEPGGAAGALVPRAGAGFYMVESVGPGYVEPLAAESAVKLRAGSEVWKFYLSASECLFCGSHNPTLHARRRPSLAEEPTDLCQP